MANFNLNKVILGGRLTSDPELRQTTSGIPVCSFSVAVNRRVARQQNEEGGAQQQQTADFINCVAWRQTAEFLSRYFHKGSSVCVLGSLQVRSWTDQQGQKRISTEVVCDEINFVDSKSESAGGGYAPAPAAEQGGAGAQQTPPSYSSQANQAPKFEVVSNGDDLPF